MSSRHPPLTTSHNHVTHVPSFRPGPPVGPPNPTRTQPGSWGPPGARPVIPPALRQGHRGPDTNSTVGLDPACATPPQRQLWTCCTQHLAGAGTFHAGDAERLVGDRLPLVRLPQPGLGTSSTPSRTLGPTRQPVGAPSDGEYLRRWGGSTPATPLLSIRGCKWGPIPLSSINQ